MIKAIIKDKDGGTVVMELPCGNYEISAKLQVEGIRKSPKEIYLTADDDREIRVKLFADTETDTHLLRVLTEKNTLADANSISHIIARADEDVRAALEENILNNRYSTIEEIMEDSRNLICIYGPFTEVFYCPLAGNLDDEGEMYEADAAMLVAHKDSIKAAMAKEQAPELGDMAQYFYGDEGAEHKLVSAEWTAECINGRLYGKIVCSLKAPLADNEKETLKDWIEGENSDGLGEGFEQRPIPTDYGDLYVSYWHSGNDYFIYDSNEMDAYLNQSNGMEMV